MSPTSFSTIAPYSSTRALRAVQRLGPAERRHRRRQMLAERRGHHVEPRDRVVVGPVDPFVGAVPVHRVGDQRDGALVVVDGGDVGGQQQQHVGQAAGRRRPARAVVPAAAPCRRRRSRPGRMTAAAGRAAGSVFQQFQRRAQRLQRIAAAAVRPAASSPSHTASPSRTVSADGRTRADERPARPRPAVLGRLQQERPGPVGGQLAVRRQRGLAVGEHLAGHRHHAVLGGQRPEVLARGGDGEVGGRLHEVNPPRPCRTGGRSVTPMKRGDQVAEFELPDQTGTVRSLTELLADGPVVLFFYPAAMTPGCTKEACHFRDLAVGVRRGRRQARRHQHRRRREAGEVRRQAALRLPAAVRRRRHRRDPVRGQARTARESSCRSSGPRSSSTPTAPCST